MDRAARMPPADLRAAIAADLSPVRPLRAPMRRALAVAPVGVLLLVAAPAVFELRDLDALGWRLSWGASILQLAAGLLLAGAALREAVPGRSWPPAALAALVATPILFVVFVTIESWDASPVRLRAVALEIGLVCLASSVITALPATLLTAVLALRALPVRPWAAGGLAGLGGGLMADAGWRLFCQFSEPSHVLAGHLGGVLAAAAFGAGVTAWLAARRA